MEESNEFNRSFEPMDVDISSQSISKMDISDDNSSMVAETIHNLGSSTVKMNTDVSKQILESKIKKFHINMQNKVHSKNAMKMKIFSVVFIILISISFYNISNINCAKEVNLEHLRKTLTDHLIGQAAVIDSIVESLGVQEKSKILFFYGGTGVGKTFAATLLMEVFGYSSNLYHYTLPSFYKSISTDLMFGMILCPNSLIIIDDCDSINENFSQDINDIITKSESLSKNITVVLIYNCDYIESNFVKKCDENFYIKLLENFKNIQTMKKVIKFESLTKFHLRKCIEKEMGNKTITTEAFEIISKNFDVTTDGCKGVHNKMKLLNIM